MATLYLNADNNSQPSKNIALSPFGYTPRTAWRRFSGVLRCCMRFAFVATISLFLALTTQAFLF